MIPNRCCYIYDDDRVREMIQNKHLKVRRIEYIPSNMLLININVQAPHVTVKTCNQPSANPDYQVHFRLHYQPIGKW